MQMELSQAKGWIFMLPRKGFADLTLGEPDKPNYRLVSSPNGTLINNSVAEDTD
jgi:hypothetical protein